jgi:hypothetical protein
MAKDWEELAKALIRRRSTEAERAFRPAVRPMRRLAFWVSLSSF